jgi:hypothetical protein
MGAADADGQAECREHVLRTWRGTCGAALHRILPVGGLVWGGPHVTCLPANRTAPATVTAR